MKFLILLTLLTGCGAMESKLFRCDPELKPYYQAFLYEASLRGKSIHVDNLIVRFGTPKDPKALGVCVYYETRYENGINTTPTPEIVIDPIKWKTLNELDKTSLLIHEAGHCVLKKLKHDDRKNSEGRPSSIMNTYQVSMSDPKYLEAHWSEYMDELFR